MRDHEVVGEQRVQGAPRYADGNDPPTGRDEIGLRVRVRRAPRGERRVGVVAAAHRPGVVRRADRDRVRVDAGRHDGVALRSAVPRRSHDHQTALPRDLHSRRHWIGPIRSGDGRAERHVDDADAVGVLVCDDPLDATNDR